jgi:SAM-dependent methyltransferase
MSPVLARDGSGSSDEPRSGKNNLPTGSAIPRQLLLSQVTRNLGNFISNTIILVELGRLLRTEVRDREGSILDVGSGSKPYEDLYKIYFAKCVSTDVPSSLHDITGVDVIAPAEALPFPDESFDCVLCTEVLEHCARPGVALGEFHRVLKPGGTCFLTTPFLRPLHEMPYDYFRFTPPGLQQLAKEAGFRVAWIRPRGEYFALLLLTCQFLLTKFWRALSKLFRMNLYHPLNPLVFLFVALPQIGYLGVWYLLRRSENSLVNKRLRKVFGHYALGYITVLRRPDRVGDVEETL